MYCRVHRVQRNNLGKPVNYDHEEIEKEKENRKINKDGDSNLTPTNQGRNATNSSSTLFPSPSSSSSFSSCSSSIQRHSKIKGGEDESTSENCTAGGTYEICFHIKEAWNIFEVRTSSALSSFYLIFSCIAVDVNLHS